MPFDTYLTKSIATGSAATFYPVGVIQSGGSSVDEFDVHKMPLGNQMTLAIIVPAAVTGTSSPTMAVSIQSDDNTSFSSAVERTAGSNILSTSGTASNGVGRYEYPIPYIPERYIRVKLVVTGTNPDFGTVTAAIIPAGNLYRQA